MKKRGRPKEREDVRHCEIYECRKRRWLQICCADCKAKDCEARCLNLPEKCGLAREVMR